VTPRYEEHAPPAELAAHVHCIWTFEFDEAGVEQAVPPDGRSELIVQLATPYEERTGDGGWVVQPRLLFAGQLTRPLVLRSRGAVSVLGVRFAPAGAWAFVDAPLSACNDRRIAVADLHGAAAAAALDVALERAGASAGTGTDPNAGTGTGTNAGTNADASGDAARRARRDAVCAWVAVQVAQRGSRRDAAVERAVALLQASEGRVPLDALVAASGLGERQLQRRFAAVVGLSPRTLGSVIRLRRVFEALREAPVSTWSQRAQAAGFFDHPQMARDFRRLIGRTPTRWTKAGPGLAASLADADA
jgi:methylphosphotriester-DNA--protein-cysteine methyltransferase